MRPNTQKCTYIHAQSLVIACLAVLISFLWQGKTGFNLWDEGFLWYGAQRVMKGEVPIRDFMAYDPGRYYWTAAIMSLAGDDGIMSLRTAVAIFQALGLFVGLLLIAQSGKDKASPFFWIVSAAIFMVWMFPRHKLFDISWSLILIGALAYLARNPIPRRYFIAGACVGMAAVFGRNHGMYSAAASVGLIVWINLNQRSTSSAWRGGLLWIAGVLLGFLPVLLMLVLIPGLAAPFWESIRFLFEQKATNLPLPVPWPWTVHFTNTPPADVLRNILVGMFFIAMPVFAGLSFWWLASRKGNAIPAHPAFVASVCLALPYAHFAYSRADIGHLAQGIFPLLIGCLALLSSARASVRWTFTAALFGASFWVMHAAHPGWQCLASQQCVAVEVSGSSLQVDRNTASDIALLRRMDAQFSSDGKSFIATPFWPGAYALLDRKAPLWEIFSLFPRTADFEHKEIERIRNAKPGFALVFDFPLDGREELRFKNTHPMINQYILDHFEPVSASQNPAYQTYKARSEGQ